ATPGHFLEPKPVQARPAQGEFELDGLRRFWRDPVRSALRDGNGLDLDVVGAESWPDREPLTPDVDPRERFERRLLFEALERGDGLSPELPAWLENSGELAAGVPGEIAYTTMVEKVEPVLAIAREVLAAGPLQREAQAIDLDLGGGRRLVGRVERVLRAADGSLLLFDAQPARESGLREWLGFHIEWAALRLALGARIDAAFIESPEKKPARMPAWLGVMRAQDEASLRAGLRLLVDAWQASSLQPLLYFPSTALAYAQAPARDRMAKARKQWEGDDFGPKGERNYAPGYAQLATRGLDLFDPRSRALPAFIEAVELVAGVLDPHRALLFVPEGDEASQADARRAPAGAG
ncbi:MAG TPA: exodeoxyribonuclease V subunit gamma, partial [Dokdonella sp.]